MNNKYYELAKSKGFHDDDESVDGKPTPRQMLAWAALIMSEWLEMQLESRPWYLRDDGKPEGIVAELVDIWIRCQDCAGAIANVILDPDGRQCSGYFESRKKWIAMFSALIESARKGDPDSFLGTVVKLAAWSYRCGVRELGGHDGASPPSSFSDAIAAKHEFNKTRPFLHGKKA